MSRYSTLFVWYGMYCTLYANVGVPYQMLQRARGVLRWPVLLSHVGEDVALNHFAISSGSIGKPARGGGLCTAVYVPPRKDGTLHARSIPCSLYLEIWI